MTTTTRPKAVVLGVGPERGLGGALCRRFASEGHHVFIAGRTQEKVEMLEETLTEEGYSATAVACDATRESDIIQLFDVVSSVGTGPLDLAVYNVGNSRPGTIREMDAQYFEDSWKLLCFGGFLFGRECTRRMLPGGGTLIFTGASASLRGKANFGAFNSGKAAQRTLAQAMAKEYGKEGLHVGHVIIDGGIAGDKWFSRLEKEPEGDDVNRFISLDALTDAYWNLHKQDRSGWSFEVDLRTAVEDW